MYVFQLKYTVTQPVQKWMYFLFRKQGTLLDIK